MTKPRESGFALLFVFAMASIIAITLYLAMPAITFEAQRDKEELLIQRGEQYKRGIQLYVRKFKRFPAKMEDLDNANGIRFLRHHYSDPLTGKEEWRIIHAGPGGVLLDSLVKTKDKDKKEAGQTAISELLGVGGVPEADPAGNLALRKRPSDQPGAPGSSTSSAISGAATAAPGAPIPPDPPQGVLPGANTANGNLAGQPPNQNTLPAGFPSQGPTGAGTQLPGAFPGSQNAAGSAVNSQTGGFSAGSGIGSTGPQTNPGQTPVPGLVSQQITTPAGQNGTQPLGGTPNAQGASDAARLIQNLLTTPRPGGLAGLQGNAGGNQTLGGGIAGVASTVKTGSGIKIYNDQGEYKKWEFVYDPSKEVQAAGTPQQGRPPGIPVGQQPGAAPGTNTGFGGSVVPQVPGVPIK